MNDGGSFGGLADSAIDWRKEFFSGEMANFDLSEAALLPTDSRSSSRSEACRIFCRAEQQMYSYGIAVTSVREHKR